MIRGVHQRHVPSKIAAHAEPTVAMKASKGLLSCMDADVGDQAATVRSTPSTVRT